MIRSALKLNPKPATLCDNFAIHLMLQRAYLAQSFLPVKQTLNLKFVGFSKTAHIIVTLLLWYVLEMHIRSRNTENSKQNFRDTQCQQ